VGALRDRTISDADRERYQWNLLRSHAVSAGRPLSRERMRAGMVVRANQLAAGGAGVAPELLESLGSCGRGRRGSAERVVQAWRATAPVRSVITYWNRSKTLKP